MTRKLRRLILIGTAFSVFAISVGIALYVLSLSNVSTFFYSPTDIVQKGSAPDVRLRLGGLVEVGSVKRTVDGEVHFRVSDMTQSVAVVYAGILPDLFDEGYGVIAEGFLGMDGVFIADRVMAKHDEVYMPPAVATALEAQGVK